MFYCIKALFAAIEPKLGKFISKIKNNQRMKMRTFFFHYVNH